MASDSHVDRSITEPVTFVQNNVNIALNVLEYAKKLKGLEKFIQISTDEVFGAALEGHNHTEWETHIPSNPYSASKSCQEQICTSYWRSYGVPLIITNTMNIIGERQDPEKFLPMLISRINKGETVTIHGSEKYVGKRYYLHARNQADALLHILKNIEPIMYYDDMSKIIKPERFNIVGDIELDNLTLAKTVAEIMGKELKYELIDFHHARPGHDRRYALDGSKIAKTGWKAPVNFRDSLEKTIKWTLKNREWLL
jgi:dTDP-glucose 4,6-dehydratase